MPEDVYREPADDETGELTDDEFDVLFEQSRDDVVERGCAFWQGCVTCGRQIDHHRWELTLPPEPGVPPEYLRLFYGLCDDCAEQPGAVEAMQSSILELHGLTADQVTWWKLPVLSELPRPEWPWSEQKT
jgi:hypothetical protein